MSAADDKRKGTTCAVCILRKRYADAAVKRAVAAERRKMFKILNDQIDVYRDNSKYATDADLAAFNFAMGALMHVSRRLRAAKARAGGVKR